MGRTLRLAGAGLAGLAAVAARDLMQREHTLLRNFPVIGHARYLLEEIGPELRQYLVAGNNEERPFTRDQRRWVYASAKGDNNYFGFGTDNDLEYTAGYPVINHRTFGRAVPTTNVHAGHDVDLPAAKVLGAARGRRQAFRPESVVNISAMSFGSLSGAAIEALNRGAALAGCMHNTGEGGLSRHHRHGADLVLQIGTAYFGCRDEHGRFDLQRLKDLVAGAPVRALEIKLSQGAKPGLGGVLPAAKVSAEIAAARGVREGVDCISPSRHAEFSDPDSLLDWVELLATEAGLPEQVGFIGAGKLGLPDNAVVAFALGCDMVNVAREAMLAIGCIQAQKCHTDTCPTGVATQNAWLSRGLDPALKSVRAAPYVRTLRRDLLKVAEACGVEHPGLIDTDAVEVLTGRTASTPLREVYGYQPEWGLPSAADREAIIRLMTATEPPGR